MKTDNRMTYDTIIFSLGNSQAVRLPKRLLESLSYAVNDPVELSAGEDGSIVIKKTAQKPYRTPYRTLKDRFSDYVGDYQPGEWDTGEPVGKELL